MIYSINSCNSRKYLYLPHQNGIFKGLGAFEDSILCSYRKYQYTSSTNYREIEIFKGLGGFTKISIPHRKGLEFLRGGEGLRKLYP